MATKYEGATRTDNGYLIDPMQILVKEEDRNREFPPSEQEILGLAYSMFKQGQKQAITCRPYKDGGLNRVKLAWGFTRTAAARLIVQGFTFHHADGTTEDCKNPEFVLLSAIKNQDEDDAFLGNLTENLVRNDLSVIDHARNQEKLRTQMNWDDAAIANFYHCSVSLVNRNKKLLNLSRAHKMLVHTDKLPVTAALDLLEYPEEQRDALVAKLMDAGTELTITNVRKEMRESAAAPKVEGQVKDAHLRDEGDKAPAVAGAEGQSSTLAETPKVQAGVFKARSEREVKQVLELYVKEDGPRGDWAKLMIEFKAGRITDSEFAIGMDRIFDQVNALAAA